MRTVSFVPGLLLVLLLSGCGGEARIASQAVREGAEALGRSSTREVVVPSSTVARIADESDLTASQVADIATDLDRQTIWQRARGPAASAYRAAQDEAAVAVTNIACQGFTGLITTEQELDTAIAGEIKGALTPDRALALRSSVIELWQNLNTAYAAGDQERAAALLTCFTFDQVAH